MRQQEYDLTIYRSQEKDFLSVPFELDDDTERLEVSYQFNKSSQIDLGVFCNDQTRGWSGGERSDFYITREHATPGYQPGLPQGRWEVVLGTYAVNEDELQVRVTVRQFKKSFRWFRGDLHAHTQHSDGTFTMAEAISCCRSQRLDFLCTTDHNTTTQNELRLEDDFLLIPGVELTTYQGHCNYLGVKHPISDFRIRNRDDLDRCMDEAISAGAVVGLNHPFTDCGWDWGFDVPYDYVEVWNGPWGRRNDLALAWWHGQLCAGRRIAAIGGSDTHKKSQMTRHGHPTTHVYADEQTASAILASVKAGRAYITSSPDAPELDLTTQCGAVMGDSVAAGSRVQLTASQLQPGDLVRVVDATGLLGEVKVESDSFSSGQLLKNQFIRMEVWRNSESLGRLAPVAIANPVYAEQAE